jgi:hypothetical protein
LGRGSREWSEGGARHRSGQADVDVTSDVFESLVQVTGRYRYSRFISIADTN